MNIAYPENVCMDCGNAAQYNKAKIFTIIWDLDICDVCGKQKPVTAVSGLGYPAFKTKGVKNENRNI